MSPTIYFAVHVFLRHRDTGPWGNLCNLILKIIISTQHLGLGMWNTLCGMILCPTTSTWWAIYPAMGGPTGWPVPSFAGRHRSSDWMKWRKNCFCGLFCFFSKIPCNFGHSTTNVSVLIYWIFPNESLHSLAVTFFSALFTQIVG